MPVTEIRDGSGTCIWSGPGRVRVTGRTGLPCHLAIEQTAQRGGQRIGRALDLGDLVDQYLVDWTVEYDVPQWTADPGDVTVEFPAFSERRWVLRIDAPRAVLDHIARRLAEPLLTDAERQLQREENDRQRRMWEDQVLHAFALPDALAHSADELGRVAASAERAGGAVLSAASAISGFINRSADEQARRDRARTEGLVRPDGSPDWEAAFRRNEGVIDSALEAFPYDPLQYGRIYPGNAGTSHWTPPDDPDEKIRSCP